MADLAGWRIDHQYDIPGDAAADVTIGQILTLSAEDTFAVAGAGEVPIGAAFETRDISEDGARISAATQGAQFMGIVGSTGWSDLAIPLKTGATGTLVPCDTDLDPIAGWPLRIEATAGAMAPYRPAFGTFYGV